MDDGHMIPGEEFGLGFLTFVLQLRKPPEKKTSTKNQIQPGIEFRIAGEEESRKQWYLPCKAVVKFFLSLLYFRMSCLHYRDQLQNSILAAK